MTYEDKLEQNMQREDMNLNHQLDLLDQNKHC